MKNIVLFLFSYLLGLASIFASGEMVLFHIVLVSLYGVLTLSLEKRMYRTLVAEPFIFSLVTVFITLTIDKSVMGNLVLYYVFIPYFIVLYSAKDVLWKEDPLIQSITLPVALPVGFCMIFLMFVQSSYTTELLFIILYYLTIGLFVQKVKTTFYAFLLMIIQIPVALYLFQFLTYFDWKEKTFIFLSIMIVFLYQISKNGGRLIFFTRSKSS